METEINIENSVTTRFVFNGSPETLSRLMYLFTEFTEGMELEIDMTIFNEFGHVMKSRGSDLDYEHNLGFFTYDGQPECFKNGYCKVYKKLLFSFYSKHDEPCFDVIRFMFDYAYNQTKDSTFHSVGNYYHTVDGEMGHFKIDKDGMVVVRGNPSMSFNEFKTTSHFWYDNVYETLGQYVDRVINRDLYKMGLRDSSCIRPLL